MRRAWRCDVLVRLLKTILQRGKRETRKRLKNRRTFGRNILLGLIVFSVVQYVFMTSILETINASLDWVHKRILMFPQQPPEWCPKVPPNLVGGLNVSLAEPSWTDIVTNNPDLTDGGRYRPTSCRARHRVALIIPYRDREEQLKIFLHQLHPLLQKQQIDYGIYVVQQDSNSTFNRGILMNIGFVEASALYDYSCFIFHDVDLLPEDDRNLYWCPSEDEPRHMSVAIDKFNYTLPYPDIFGGICAFNKEQFRDINGFPNIYFGWGGEDDDLFIRLKQRNITVSRYSEDIARYKMIVHEESKQVNPIRLELSWSATKRNNNDGLNSLTYSLESVDVFKMYTQLNVRLDEAKITEGWNLSSYERVLTTETTTLPPENVTQL